MLAPPVLLQVAAEPVQDDAKSLQPVARRPRARELVILAREAHEEHLALELLEGHEELLGLLDRAAVVLLRVHDEERRGDARGIGEGRALRVPAWILPRHRPAHRDR